MAMTITYTNNGDGTATLGMDFTGTKTKLDLLGTEAGEYFYNTRWTLYDGNNDPIAWADLTNQQKLDVLGKETKYHLKNGAYAEYHNVALQTTEDTLDDSDTRYDLTD